ncbi:glutamate--cysteine ligase [endosymbiont of Ridgeia piscesae]|uniref:Glutamate--cysteine ligase n=1 Tax=endosymbiont of Ridgeia piscesae TaxID=54398 RepID=A0A0T5YWX7_9GAMM|nr:glutamate--cysteine ligase [endosymbiont of Ridgeia piscesae]KRT54734.1 glutamate-cysteine ligase [endosymbiont of Ridgeia piscesae]KRT58583.1 glutamate-cysteine ligase [endosymbiont of Ridgeia piscesae]
MLSRLEERLKKIEQNQLGILLGQGLIGLEKESLRVTPAGGIAQSAHPEALGAPLTHPYITTDYSEALTEFITPPLQQRDAVLEFLRDAQKFVYDRLEGDEILWATSMPCVVEGGCTIPIARYGSSNAGLMKTVYRRGLGHRYGRVMQVIAGVHFNYSLPEAFWPGYQALEGGKGDLQGFISEAYFGLIRNLQRFGWLVPYLFGASPAICKSFLGGRPSSLKSFDEYTYYQPYATSLRMGDIGYQNSKEQGTGVKVCYDCLDAYLETLGRAVETPCPIYQTIGVEVDGRYEQLNANILQIENEYYSTVRPKQIPDGMEKPILALRRRGVRYIELRSLDVNAFDPLGIDQPQIRFLEAFLLLCLLLESPAINVFEQKEIDRNEGAAAHRGRDPRLFLQRNGREIRLRDWALEIFDAMLPICELLDADSADQPYQQALSSLRERIIDPDLTPSAQMLAQMRQQGEPFFGFAQRMSQQHNDYFRQQRLSAEREALFRQAAATSWQRQREIEAQPQAPFGQYLADYFVQ